MQMDAIPQLETTKGSYPTIISTLPWWNRGDIQDMQVPWFLNLLPHSLTLSFLFFHANLSLNCIKGQHDGAPALQEESRPFGEGGHVLHVRANASLAVYL